jgi:outer membrane biosynthesis protein TonB
MGLGRRPKRKQDQALDLVASVAKTWSEWQLAKRASRGLKKGAGKAAELKGGKPSGLKAAVTGTPAKITGAVAVVGGLGAVALRKLKGGGDAPAYVPPAPHEPAAAPPPPPPPPPPAPGAAAHKPAPPPPPLAAAPPPKPEPVIADVPEPIIAEAPEPPADDEATDGDVPAAAAEPDEVADSGGDVEADADAVEAEDKH